MWASSCNFIFLAKAKESMKYLSYLTLFFLLLISCKNEGNDTESTAADPETTETQVESEPDVPAPANALVYGEAPGVLNGMRVYLKSVPQAKQRISESAVVKDGQFVFEKTDKDLTGQIVFMEMDQGNERETLILRDQPIYVKLYKDSISKSEIKGGADNAQLQDYQMARVDYLTKVQEWKTARGKYSREGDEQSVSEVTSEWMDAEQDYKKDMKSVISNNPNKLSSLLVLGDMLNDKMLQPNESRELFDKMDEDVQSSMVGKQIDSYLTRMQRSEVGAKAPPIEGKTPDGKVLALKDVMGKYTLVDFWASWCRPCRMENPNVVKAYQKYHDKGFNILSVSLDKKNQEEAWKRAIEQDNMTWHHVSKLMYFNDPAAKQYNVNAIPATFLLDENGIIIAKNLRGSALHNKLEELLGA